MVSDHLQRFRKVWIVNWYHWREFKEWHILVTYHGQIFRNNFKLFSNSIFVVTCSSICYHLLYKKKYFINFETSKYIFSLRKLVKCFGILEPSMPHLKCVTERASKGFYSYQPSILLDDLFQKRFSLESKPYFPIYWFSVYWQLFPLCRWLAWLILVEYQVVTGVKKY